MIYNKKSRVYKMRKIILAVLAIALTSLILVSWYFFYRNTASAGTSLPAVKDNGGISEKSKAVVRAKVMMYPGEPADVQKFEIVQVPVELIPENAITDVSQIKGMLMRNTVEKKELITANDLMPKNAWFEDGDRLIEHNFAEGAVPASVEAGSLIDIKLFKPGEEDNVVVSKAAVISRDGNLLSFYLNAEEQEYIKESAAEGMLFAVRYIDETQTESSVTYVPPYGKKTDSFSVR